MGQDRQAIVVQAAALVAAVRVSAECSKHPIWRRLSVSPLALVARVALQELLTTHQEQTEAREAQPLLDQFSRLLEVVLELALKPAAPTLGAVAVAGRVAQEIRLVVYQASQRLVVLALKTMTILAAAALALQAAQQDR